MVNTYDRILTKGPESALPSTYEEGKLRFTTDTGRMFIDNQNNRVEVTDFVKGLTEAEIKAQLAPLTSKIYVSSDTNKLFYYSDNEWNTISNYDDITKIDPKSVSGNPIVIEDAAAVNVDELKISWCPQQDLHGFDHPWIGGASKNKLFTTLANLKEKNNNGTWSGNTFTSVNNVEFAVNTDSDENVISITITRKGTGTDNSDFYIGGVFSSTTSFIPSNTLTCSAEGIESGMLFIAGYGNTATITVNGTLPATAQCNNGISWAFIRVPSNVSPSNVTVKPMIRLSTETDATFEPYTNICSISGLAESQITIDSDNLFNIAGTNGITPQITGNRFSLYANGGGNWQSCNFGGNSDLKFAPGKYYIKFNVISVSNPDVFCILGFRNYNYTYVDSENITPGYHSVELTTDVNAFFSITINGQESGNKENTVVIEDLIVSTVDIPFYPYNKQTVSIQLGQTVYEGYIDINTGKCTITYTTKKLLSTDSWNKSQTGYNAFYISGQYVSPVKKNPSYSISNIAYWSENDNDYTIKPWILTKDSSLGMSTDPNIIGGTTVDDWKTFLDNNDVYICYELSTPIITTLSVDKLKLLKGHNRICTNGDIIDLTYQADNILGEAKEYIDNKINEINSNLTNVKQTVNHTVSYSAQDLQITGVNAFKNANTVCVSVTISLSNYTAGEWNVIGTLPSELRPRSEMRFCAYNNTILSKEKAYTYPVRIQTNGELGVYIWGDVTEGVSISQAFTYIADDV